MKWEKDIKLSGKDAIVLVRKLLYGDSDTEEYSYELLGLFRLNENSKWSIDGSLASMCADNFNPEYYDGFIVIENI